MDIYSIIASWVVGVAAARVICATKKNENEAGANRTAGCPVPDDDWQPGCWCDAIEKITGSCAIVLDKSLRIKAAGTKAEQNLKIGDEKNHLIDVIPEVLVAEVIACAQAAAREGKRRVKIEQGGALFEVCAIAICGETLLLLGIEKI